MEKETETRATRNIFQIQIELDDLTPSERRIVLHEINAHGILNRAHGQTLIRLLFTICIQKDVRKQRGRPPTINREFIL